MRGREISKTLDERQASEHRFVKWWRKENDFLDVELVDGFRKRVTENEEIGGLELLTMDDMEQEVKRLCGQRVKIVHGKGGDKIEWRHLSKKGDHTDIWPRTPESLMTIYDAETKGNPVD
jgi:hypothetical protein